MKLLTTVLLLGLLAQVQLVNAQQARDWIQVAPSDERFEVRLPQQPKVEPAESEYDSSYGPRTVKGKVYYASLEGSTYAIWSLETLRTPSSQVDEIGIFLDEYADLIWESLLKPARDALPKTANAWMIYGSEISMGVIPIPGREYQLQLGDTAGAVRFYLDGGRLYVLAATSPIRNSGTAQSFFSGFLAKSLTNSPFLPVAATLETEPNAPVFQPGETTIRAKVLSKPEPQYNDAARKYRVTGTIVLRAVISPDGRVTNIRIVKRLPHGLTQAAVAAAQRARFSPATKDGQAVFQSIQFEYNFNLY